MTAHTHSGSLLCPSLTRVRAMPVVERGRHHAVQSSKAAAIEMPKLSPALMTSETAYKAKPADVAKRPQTARNRKTDNIEYRLIFAGAFAVFFVAAVFERALPTRWAAAAQGPAAIRKPIVTQAKEAASISAGYAFMG